MAGVWEEALVEEVVCFMEKLIRRLECPLQSGDMEKAKELSEKVKELYCAKRTYALWSKTCPTKT